jgi:ornithine cyclodeaminase/alanine dehydrogenase-like protein (mu-crystallin family)
VRPIDAVLAYDADPDVARSLEARLTVSGLKVEVVSANELESLVAAADILCTATSVDIGGNPVIPHVAMKPWLHINAVGADFAGKIELPKSLLEDALVCPDVLGQCLIEGESQQLSVDQLGPELADLVKNRSTFEAHRSSLTVFDSTGWALEDLIAAELFLDHAERLGVGLDVELQPLPNDPYDPYEAIKR